MENNERELEELELMNENEDRKYYVYVHIRKDNNTVFYVGKGTGDRAYNLDRSDFHDKVRDKYGCRVEIIKDNLTESQAFRLESKMIKYYVLTLGYGAPIDGYDDFDHNLPYLTNFTWGGEGSSGYKHTEEAKRKIGENTSKALKGHKHSEETKRKMSEKNKGENNPMYGKKLSEETKEKISEKVSGENNGMFGKNPYANKTTEEMEEIGKRMSESRKGEKNGMWGKGKKVVCITTGEKFDSINQAATHYNHYKVSKSTIIRCCKGKQKSTGELPDGTKLQWKYLEDDDNESKAV